MISLLHSVTHTSVSSIYSTNGRLVGHVSLHHFYPFYSTKYLPGIVHELIHILSLDVVVDDYMYYIPSEQFYKQIYLPSSTL